MRIKISTESPALPALKAWFSPNSLNATIAELKADLCTRLPPLADAQAKSRDISLLLDDFELLDDLQTQDLVRDGDLLVVRLLSVTGVKRKSPERAESPNKKRKRSPSPTPRDKHLHKSAALPSASTDSDSDDDSSSDTSSASSSTSTSSTSSSSSSSSKASSVSVPSPRTSKLPPPAVFVKNPPQPPLPNVPPGQGKPATRNRNARRRIKKQFERTGSIPDAPPHASMTNLLPLGSALPQLTNASAADVDVSMEGGSSVMMASLRNKNKKRGFRHTLNGPIPAKIVFTDDDSPVPGPSGGLEALTVPVGPEAPFLPLPRLVPPSEKQERGELPTNMFVTSVDVEEGKWIKGKRSRDQKWLALQEDARDLMTVERQTRSQLVTAARSPPANLLDRSDVVTVSASSFDFDRVESSWDRFSEISSAEQLLPDQLVGWKALGINPTTFTPEWLLTVARVISANVSLESGLVSVSVKPLLRPGSTQISFGAYHDNAEDNEQQEEETEGEVEEHRWQDVLEGKWRIVHID